MLISIPHSISRMMGFDHAILFPPKDSKVFCIVSFMAVGLNVYETKVHVWHFSERRIERMGCNIPPVKILGTNADSSSLIVKSRLFKQFRFSPNSSASKLRNPFPKQVYEGAKLYHIQSMAI